MKQIIDIDQWERKEDYDFFKNFLNPMFAVTAEIACGAAKVRAKQKGQSFFIYYTYAIARAINETKELRFRIEGDKVVMYDKIDVAAPILIKESGRLVNVRIPYTENFEQFYTDAERIIAAVSNKSGSYDALGSPSGEVDNGMVMISAMPELHFTSLSHAMGDSSGHPFTLMNVGKVIQREGEEYMPIAISVHHALANGMHVSNFFKKVTEVLRFV